MLSLLREVAAPWLTRRGGKLRDAEWLAVATGRICCELSAAGEGLLCVTDSVLTPLLDGLRACVPLFVLLGILLDLLASPLPGEVLECFSAVIRGAASSSQPGERSSPGHRSMRSTDASRVGRCHDSATEADHVYAWSRGGPTVVSSGRALSCAAWSAG
jgi:hypothetical protein